MRYRVGMSKNQPLGKLVLCALLLLQIGYAAENDFPYFDQPLPTIVITDRLEKPSALYDPGLPDTQYVFRYTDAFNPYDYIGLFGNDAGTVRFLFNEFDDVSDTTPNTNSTISINDQTALGRFPDDEDFALAVPVSVSPDGLANHFDFRNIDFSPGSFRDSAPGSNIGSVTGDDIEQQGSQSRIVTIYMTQRDQFADAASMLVVTKRATTIEEGDSIEESLFYDPFSCIFAPQELSGWEAGAIGLLHGIPLNGPRSTAVTFGPGYLNISGFSNSPSVTFNSNLATPGGISSLGLTSNIAQIGFASWSLPADRGPAVALNHLYRARISIQSSNANTSEVFRLRIGNSQTGIGDANHGFFATNPPSEPKLQTTATDFYTYLFAKDSGDLQINIDLIDQNGDFTGFNGTGSEEWTVSSVEVCEATREGLGQGTLLWNFGAVPSSISSGQPIVPEPGPEAFNTMTNFSAGNSLNSARPVVVTPSSVSRSFTYGTVSVGNPFFDPATDFVRTSYPGSLTLEEGKLYAVDVWLSTNNGLASPKPDLRMQMVGNNYFAEYRATLDPTVGDDVPNPAAATSSAKVYSLFFEPQLNGTGPVSAGVFIDLLELITQVPAGTSITIHQVTAWEWVL